MVSDLAARGYLDDAAYARHWVATRVSRGYGPARLRSELRARGVAPRLIDDALTAMEPGEPLARAWDAARRRLPALRRGRADRVAPRLRDYLLRRGYAAGVVARVVRESTGVVEDG